jgi:MFS family permease
MSDLAAPASPADAVRPVNKQLVLAAMVFAVAMTFIDQTIVAIATPSLQKDLSLTATGSQWIINGYVLALAALFAFTFLVAVRWLPRGRVELPEEEGAVPAPAIDPAARRA